MLLLVKNRLLLITSAIFSGGGCHGVMGALNRGARSMNGKIIGVIHEKWCVDGAEDALIADMIVVGMISISFLSILPPSIAAKWNFHVLSLFMDLCCRRIPIHYRIPIYNFLLRAL